MRASNTLIVTCLAGALVLGSQIGVSAKENKHQALMKKAGAIAKQVAKIRGLRIKRPIKRGVMSKKQIRARILKRLDQEYSAKDLIAEEVSLKRFGLLGPKANYKKLVVDLLTDQVAGFYDPKEQRLYIAGWDMSKGKLGAMMGDVTMAHEIAHALQDQHFNLARFMKTRKSEGDAMVARQAVVEGDGTAVMIEYMMSAAMKGVKVNAAQIWANDQIVKMMERQVPSGMGGKSMAKVPLFMREALIFPYIGGLRFIAHFRKRHSWRRIDRVYRKPPLSSEQVLHPEKYVTYERPKRVRARTLKALAGYEKLKENVMGEMGIGSFLRQHGVKHAKANAAAAGWGGDRMVVYQKKGSKSSDDAVGVLYTVWDHQADAREFFESANLVAAKLSGGKITVNKAEQHVAYTSGTWRLDVERRKDAVVMIIGAPTSTADAIRSQLWKRWKRSR